MKRWNVTTWALWTLPQRVMAYVLLVDVAAGAVIVMWPHFFPPRFSDWAGPAWLVLCAGLGVEGSRWVERVRERPSNAPYKDIYSMWTVTAVLVFGPSGAAAFVVALYTWAWIRVKREPDRTHRWIFTTSTVVLSVAVSSAAYREMLGEQFGERGMLHHPVAPLAGLAAGVLSVALNAVLVAVVFLLVEPRTGFGKALGANRRDQCIEASAICLAVLVACGYAISPWLVLLTLPVILLLERTLLLSQFETAARIDAKTGLPNARWWHEVAQREFDRVGQADGQVSVLIGDLDHFKRVNDTYGHLAGDVVLRHVARVFATEVRDNDIVGRFGGEEFVVVLPFTDAEQAGRVAERLRRRVALLSVEVDGVDQHRQVVQGVTVSIGAATYPEHGEEFVELLRLADAALYEAKYAGRNQVRSAGKSQKVRHSPSQSP